MSINKVMMAFAGGKESSDSTGSIKRYVGLGVFTVLAVNPTKAELEKIYNTTLEKDPDYVIPATAENKQRLRISFILSTVPDHCNGIEAIIPVNYFLEDSPRYNKDKTKVQCINAYGEVAYIDIESAKVGAIPSNMSWFEGPYRPAFVGEENLTKFLKAFVNIPNKSFRKPDGTIVELPNKADALARFDGIKTWFSGNIAEVKQTVSHQPNNKVKLACGVRTTDDNKTFQTVYSDMPLKSGVNNYTKLDEAITTRQAAGAYPSTVFSIATLMEYSIGATTFEAPAATSASDPFFE